MFKRIILILFLSLISLNILSQETIYQCVSTTITDVVTKKNVISPSNFLIKINADSGIVYINNRAHSKYSIKQTIEERKYISNNGDIYVSNLFDSIDEEKKPCKLTVTSYKDINITIISAEYADIIITWKAYLVSETVKPKSINI